MTAPCPHGSADPHLCMECRRERLPGRPIPGQWAAELAAAVRSAPLDDADDVDHARMLAEDLRSTMAVVRYVALPWEDAAALFKAATRRRAAGWLAPDVTLRVAAALAEAFAAEPGLRPDHPNAVPPAATESDHGSNSTGVDLGRRPGDDRDPDPP